MLLLVACSNSEEERYALFVGESENWRVNLEVEILESEGTNMSYTFTYTGEESKPDLVYYEVEPGGDIAGDAKLNDRNEIYLSQVGDTAPVYKSTVFPVTMSLNVVITSLKIIYLTILVLLTFFVSEIRKTSC